MVGVGVGWSVGVVEGSGVGACVGSGSSAVKVIVVIGSSESRGLVPVTISRPSGKPSPSES